MVRTHRQCISHHVQLFQFYLLFLVVFSFCSSTFSVKIIFIVFGCFVYLFWIFKMSSKKKVWKSSKSYILKRKEKEKGMQNEYERGAAGSHLLESDITFQAESQRGGCGQLWKTAIRKTKRTLAFNKKSLPFTLNQPYIILWDICSIQHCQLCVQTFLSSILKRVE